MPQPFTLLPHGIDFILNYPSIKFRSNENYTVGKAMLNVFSAILYKRTSVDFIIAYG